MFARRAIQRRITELRSLIRDKAVDNIALRLNCPGKDRLAAIWEVVVLHGLAKCGVLRSEVPLISGRCPDVSFENSELRITADITVVSNDGLDEANPYFELRKQIEKAKTKLGLPRGGVDLRVISYNCRTVRGTQTVLRLPPRQQIHGFVRDKVVPQLRDQTRSRKDLIRVVIDDNEAGIEVTIDPTKSPFSSGSFGAYFIPTIKNRNPLYNALKSKADQLRGAEGIIGVIVCDGDCTALAYRKASHNEVTAAAIIKEFLRQYSSIHFVLLLTVREEFHTLPSARMRRRWVQPVLHVRVESPVNAELDKLFAAMVAEFPKPDAMPVNAALRAREEGYDLGHHGGFTMGGGKIRISSREMMEILAGLRTFKDNGAKHIPISQREAREPNLVEAAFLRHVQQGRLPSAITVIKTDEDDNDDWIEFEFGNPDPAISPIK